MTKIKALFIDMDDTLIVNEVLYDHARAMLRGYLHHFGIKANEVNEAIDRIDAEMVKTHGTSRHRYPATYEAVARHFIPNADEEIIGNARHFAETVFETVAPVKPGTLEAIDLLTSHYDVYIVTQGDQKVQETRLLHLPFRDKITDAFIVEKKDQATFETLAKGLGLKPEEIIMIGDSLRSDILPSVAAGLSGILIEAKTSSSFHPMHGHGAVELPKERAYKYASLLEAAHQLVIHGTPRREIKLPAAKKNKPEMK